MLLKKGAESTIIQEISGKVWECRVTGQEAERLENHFILCSSKTENGEAVLRIVSDNKPCDTAVSVPPCLKDLYLPRMVPNYPTEKRSHSDGSLQGISIPPLTAAGLISIRDYGTAYTDGPLHWRDIPSLFHFIWRTIWSSRVKRRYTDKFGTFSYRRGAVSK